MEEGVSGVVPATQKETGEEKSPSGEKDAKMAAEVRGREGDSDHLDGVNTFEDLMGLVDTNGRWNIVTIVLCCCATVVSPFYLISYQFLGATPDYWCHVGPLEEANWTQQQILNFAIPFSNKTGDESSCVMYDYNYTLAAELGYQQSVNNLHLFSSNQTDTLTCATRDFNHTQYESTVVTEWDLVCDRRPLYSTTQAVSQFGKLLGSVGYGYLIDAWGRRKTVLVSSALTLVSGFLTALSPTLSIYIIMRIVVAAMDAGYGMGVFVLSLEISSPKQRTYIGSFTGISWSVGYMILPGIAYLVRHWQKLQAALTLPGFFLCIYIWMLPESPRWLMAQGRYQEALEVFKRAASVNRRTLPPDSAVLDAMARITKQVRTEEVREEQCGRRLVRTVRRLLSPLLLPQLRKIALPLFFCWFASSLTYYGVGLSANNLSADPYIFVFLGGLLELPGCVVLWLLLMCCGRRKSLMLLYLVCSISILLVMFLQLWYPEGPVWMRVLCSQCGKMAISSSFSLVWFYTVELFPTKYRPLALGEASMCARVGSISSPYINDILGEVTVWSPSAVFSAVSLTASGLAFLLPETTDKQLPEDLDFFNKKSKTSPPENIVMAKTGQPTEAQAGHTNPALVMNE